MSSVANKMMGTYIAEEGGAKPDVLRWFQDQIRNGPLREAAEEFVRKESVTADAGLLVVENISATHVRCRIPYYAFDHESPHPLRCDLEFKLNPLTGQVSGLT